MNDYQTWESKKFKTWIENEFHKECISKGYDCNTQQLESNGLACVTTSNGIKTEIKLIPKTGGKVTMVSGYNCKDPNKEEERDLIKDKLEKGGRWISRYFANGNRRSLVQTPFKDLKDFFKFVEQIEEIDEIVKSTRLNQYFKRSYDPLQIANRYFYAVKEKDQDLVNMRRDLLSADVYDEDIKINQKDENRTYREHVVPCICIHTEIMHRVVYDSTCTPDKIAKFIRKNLKIAYITDEDQKKIDSTLGWKVNMPNGWKWGDDILARLKLSDAGYLPLNDKNAHLE